MFPIYVDAGRGKRVGDGRRQYSVAYMQFYLYLTNIMLCICLNVFKHFAGLQCARSAANCANSNAENTE